MVFFFLFATTAVWAIATIALVLTIVTITLFLAT